MRITRTGLRFLAFWGFLSLAVLYPFNPTKAQQAASTVPVTAEEAYEIGVEAYVYFYPAVSVEVTRRIGTNVEGGKSPCHFPNCDCKDYQPRG